MAAEALKTDAAAAQPYLGWILLGVGILLVVALGVAAWWWWNKRKKTDPSSGQSVLFRHSLAKLRKSFLDALPWRYRMTVADFPTVVVLGPDEIGRTNLIEQEVDWRRQQNQFLPSYTESDLVKFYLGPDSVVEEVSERLLRDGSVQTRRALKQLWKDSLGWRKRVLVVIAIDAGWLAQTLPDDVRSFTQLLRGKINILSELCKRPIEARICLTNMDRVEGFSQFARLVKENRIPLEIAVPEAGQEASQLQESFKPLEKYLSLGLMRFSLEEFRLLERFFQQGRDMLTSLSNFIVALREGGALSVAPQLERVFLTPDPEKRSVGAFTLLAEKQAIELAKHNRWVHLRRCAVLLAVGCLPVLAAYGHFKRKLNGAQDAVDSFSGVVARLQAQGLEVSGTVIHEESQNAMSAMNDLDAAKRYWPPLRTSFSDEQAELRLQMADTLRVSYFKPALERCQHMCAQCGNQIPGCPAVKDGRSTCQQPKEPPLYFYEEQCRPEQMLYFRAVLQASRGDPLGSFILDSFDEGLMGRWNWASDALGLHVSTQEKGSDENWVDTLQLDERAAGDYIVVSDEPWSPTKEDLRTWVRWPYQGLTFEGQVGPWREHFARLSDWLNTQQLNLEDWEQLQQERQELEQLLTAAQDYQSARQILDQLNAFSTSNEESTLQGIDTTVRALEWMHEQRAPLAAVLALEAEADAALQEGLKMSPAQLLTQANGLFEPSFVSQIDLVVLRRRFLFDPPEVSQQLLDKLLLRLEKSPELAFGKSTSGGEVVSASGSTTEGEGVFNAGGTLQSSASTPVKGRAEFETELKPLVDDFSQRIAKANMPQEEAAKREAYVFGKVREFSAGYRQGLVSTFNSYQFNANRNTLLTELSTLVQPSSPLVAMLREVANLASIGPLEGPYYEPLRSAIEPFKPVTQLMTPDKDGNYAALGQYILLVAQLHGELSGTRPASDKATASKGSDDKAAGDKAGASDKDEESSASKAAAAATPESQLPELLTPAGRVALSMLMEDEDSYLKKVDAWLDKQRILGDFRTPFRQPFVTVRNLGRDDLEKVIKEQWTAERKRVLEPLFKRYPFNPESQQELDPAELTVLRRKDGEFWVFVDQVLSPLIVERGTEWSLRGPLRNQVMLPARMLSTLNFLSRLSRGLWDGQGKPTVMAMQLRPLPLPLAPSQGEFVTMSYLKCGGASAFGFNQSPAWQDFALSWWDQRAASLGVELRSPARSAKRYRTVEMPSSSWSCFRMMELGTLTDEQNMVWELPGPDGQANSVEVLAVSFGMRGSPLPLFRGVPK
ncbi:type VI secretion IcmF C-terminal domain-containing protein [Hyalangium minutum]|uniref:Uncharacterized protein n=1 Tax=Hyalangium minutum TaxID=394096 RepID=A0A085WCH3_9BACT|nr:type VI secretion IcmF C-terminal domain-containing protein [Hyalangium minutum]KFE65386.1 hypothetical protein DB31_1502 [Hyalangium minutum]